MRVKIMVEFEVTCGDESDLNAATATAAAREAVRSFSKTGESVDVHVDGQHDDFTVEIC